MPRFFVDSIASEADLAVLTGEQAAHAKVLRMKPGEAAVLCDGQGTDYQAEVTELDSSSVTLRILSRGPSESEPKVDCTVYMGFAKGDKLEHVIQKATELGANRICAFPSSRCVAKFDRKSLEKKLPRWQKIAASAAEQSGRGRIPTVFAADSYAQALELAAQADRALFFYENEQSHTLTAALEGNFTSVSINRARGRLFDGRGKSGGGCRAANLHAGQANSTVRDCAVVCAFCGDVRRRGVLSPSPLYF